MKIKFGSVEKETHCIKINSKLSNCTNYLKLPHSVTNPTLIPSKVESSFTNKGIFRIPKSSYQNMFIYSCANQTSELPFLKPNQVD